ncbi:MAG: ribonuclease D [Gammaproteobacteria bacterium]
MTQLITDARTLDALLARLAGARHVALDTEFTRTRTYYARLALVQLRVGEEIACIDPLAFDIAPLLDFLYRPDVLKIVHAGRQDLEVFYDLRGDVPRPVFDTQIAAAFAGFNDQVGYGALVEALAGVKLPKLYTRTDWEARPLSEEQLRYAEDDVRYLPALHDTLSAKLAAAGRAAWAEQEFAALTDTKLYANAPADAYRRVKQGSVLAPAAQAVLQHLAEWREHAAQQQDLPRAWVAPDTALIELARTQPATRAALEQSQLLPPGALRRWGADVLRAIERGRAAPAAPLWPEARALDAAEQSLVDRMLQRVRAVAETMQLAPAVLASRRTVVELVRAGSGPLTRGWRYELLGRELAALRDGA